VRREQVLRADRGKAELAEIGAWFVHAESRGADRGDVPAVPAPTVTTP
jgi:hypothetical protein